MSKAISFIAIELVLFVTPFVFPKISFAEAMFIYGVAITLFVFAFYLWWQPTRKLSFRQKKKLANLIREIDIEVQSLSVIPSSGTEESADYAGDIVEAINMSGWKANFDTYISGGDPTFRGVKLHVTGEVEDWVREFSAALKDVGVNNYIQNENQRGVGDLSFIDVGKPN